MALTRHFICGLPCWESLPERGTIRSVKPGEMMAQSYADQLAGIRHTLVKFQRVWMTDFLVPGNSGWFMFALCATDTQADGTP